MKKIFQENLKKRFFLFNTFFLLFFIQNSAAQKERKGDLVKPEISIKVLQKNYVPIPGIKNDMGTTSRNLDFRRTSKKVKLAVVHIISNYFGQGNPQDEFPEFFKDSFGDDFKKFFENQKPSLPEIGSGSGIIITENGYILTSKHVIAGADEIEVITDDNRSFLAKIIGTDPSTDLALLKIEEENLEFIKLGDSDQVEIGEWVLAVGNPFNLSTTVTAGIVSAKARNINVIKDQSPIESFIQTDAVVNPGNSGGALVNLKGELIGINAAIASPTGAYAGYSFAIPTNIAEKVINDLLNFGEIKRAYFGAHVSSLNSNILKILNLENTEGVYVDSIMRKSAAAQSGILEKDVILKIDDEIISSPPRLHEIIGRYRPNEKIAIQLIRDGKIKTVEVILLGENSKEKVAKNERKEILRILGVDIEKVSEKKLLQAKIKGGIIITKLYAGKLYKQTDIEEGFVITKINNQPIESIVQLASILRNKKGGVLIEGIYLNDPETIIYYAIGL